MNTPEEEYQKAERGEDHDCDLISTDARSSYWYAEDVIKGRFLKGEEAISTDANYSSCYAKGIIKGRFPKGEDIISTDAGSSYWYANLTSQDFLSKPNR
jgi:hypothetical protein